MSDRLDRLLKQIKIVSPAEAETVDAVVCMPVAETKLVMKNSHRTNCAWCGVEIWVAPSSPSKPMKICLFCAAEKLGK